MNHNSHEMYSIYCYCCYLYNLYFIKEILEKYILSIYKRINNKKIYIYYR